MFRGFDLRLNWMDFGQYYTYGKGLYDVDASRILEELETFISPEGVIDATRMEEEWFPQIKADVFISHSHDDEKLAIGLAGWLHKKFGIEAFIDSCIWGYSDKLLKSIDNRYCLNSDGKAYSYERRNRSTSHVHMILSTALAKMIDNTECLFFLNTPKSVKSEEAVLTKTSSPWIYSEISISNMIRKKIPARIRTTPAVELFSKGGEMVRLTESLEMEFTLKSGHLVKINDEDLEAWEDKFNDLNYSRRNPLDTLYKKFKIDLSTYE